MQHVSCKVIFVFEKCKMSHFSVLTIFNICMLSYSVLQPVLYAMWYLFLKNARWVGRKSMKIWQTGILNFQIQSKVTDICILKQTDKAFYKRWNNPQCYNFLLTASGRGGIKGEFLPVQHPIYITIHNLLKLNLTSLITWYFVQLITHRIYLKILSLILLVIYTMI